MVLVGITARCLPAVVVILTNATLRMRLYTCPYGALSWTFSSKGLLSSQPVDTAQSMSDGMPTHQIPRPLSRAPPRQLQAVFAHELITSGAFSPLFTPRGPPKSIGSVMNTLTAAVLQLRCPMMRAVRDVCTLAATPCHVGLVLSVGAWQAVRLANGRF